MFLSITPNSIFKLTNLEQYSILEYTLVYLFVVIGSVLLISSNDLISLFLSIELQSYGCAPGEVYTAEILIQVTIRLILSDIFGLSILFGRYLPRVITSSKANNSLDRIADYKKISQRGLPLLEVYFSGGSHGQVNEFDTYRGDQLVLYVISRISRHIKGIFNVFIGRPYDNDCQKPFTHFSIEDKNAQSPKTTNSNASVSQPRDLTASGYGFNQYLMRGRSFHSRSNISKGSSRKTSLLDAHDSNTKGADELNLAEGSKSITSISS